MTKKGYHIVLLAACAAVCFWIIDAVVDFLVHYEDQFLTILMFKQREISFRLLASAGFLIFGYIISRMFSSQKKVEDALLKEINEHRQTSEKLYTLSTRDELSGLYNRRGFFTLVEQQLKMANREKELIHIFYADMDNLKEINDSYGHQEGDQAIVEVASILQETFRESDIIARVGGDEFVAVPVGMTGETVSLISERISRNIELHNSERAKPYRISLSFGIVCYNPKSPATIDELLSEGDRLMYEQKNSKKHSQETRGQGLYFL